MLVKLGNCYIRPGWNITLKGILGASKGASTKSRLCVYFFFPTCQVRVVRFYVSLFSSSFSFSSFSFSSWSSSSSPLPPRPSPPSAPRCLSVASMWCAGPQPRSCEFSVACRTPTARPWVQCGVPDPNREPVSSVWRAGPQPRAREFSVACRTSTAILRVQCGVPDLNRDPASSVWRAGPQVMCQKICQKE